MPLWPVMLTLAALIGGFTCAEEAEEVRAARLRSERGHGVGKSCRPVCFSAASVWVGSVQRSETCSLSPLLQHLHLKMIPIK